MKTVALMLLLSISGLAQSPPPKKPPNISWGGFYLSANLVNPVKNGFTKPSLTVGGLAIINIRKRYSLQLQILQPVDGGSRAPLFRVSVDRRLF